MLKHFLICVFFIMLCEQSIIARGLSPIEFGLFEAQTGEERYEVLYNVHTEAFKKRVTVDYSGIRQIDLDIPYGARSIPLSKCTDFCNVTFNVVNTKMNNFYLFAMSNPDREIDIEKGVMATYNFNRIRSVRKGIFLLIVKDLNHWVENRTGYNYGAQRKDILN